ncbi:hypothetical protein [Spirosoma montaniterrae]|uniref:Uncharacterized protein n=1 Tax=Spirosoma montaniterrae TaxID=1178516 RepID=A0A1P9WW71_9BACT|nr:hypothetical protein [Spirosoma montaniterrae]AQG79626.1 hypothetical protein AWR27_09980 [Spirosoma montaniterrae]
MATLAQSTYTHPQTETLNWLSTYKQFAEKADFNRAGWAATILTVQGCLLSPVALLTMFYFGGGDWQLLVCNLCFLLALVPILSAQSMKYVFPAFAVSAVVHLGIMLMNVL